MSFLDGVLELLASLSDEDAAVLRLCRDKQQLQSLALDRIKHHASHIQTLSALRNSLAPIHRLPVEILMRIFYRCRRTIADIRLAHVCRHWRAIIFAMPEFWAATLRHLQLNPAHPSKSYEELLQQCLELSSPHMVQCQASFHSGFVRRILASHLHRITELSVTIWRKSVPSELAAFLAQGIPSLVTLRCRTHNRNSAYIIPSLDRRLFPALRRLEVSGEWSLSHFPTSTLEHLAVRDGIPTHNIGPFKDALANSPVLTSLTLDCAIPRLLNNHFAPAEVVRLPHIRSLSINDALDAVERCLARLALPPSVHIRLSIPFRSYYEFDKAGRLCKRLHDLLPIKRLYLGHTRARGRSARLLGYTETADGIDLEQLDTAIWHIDECSVLEMLDVFSASSATALAVSLPRAPVELRCIEGDHATVSLPHQLRRLELLVWTPLETKLWFARSFLNMCTSEQAGRLSSEELTLCWVLHIERGCEALVQEELQELEGLLMESHQHRLGRLELYGMLAQSGHTYTKVADVPTNRARCVEVVGPFTARLSALVVQVAIM